MRPTCSLCGQPITGGTYLERVAGWAPIRKGGGPNQVRNIRRPGVYAHVVCVDALRYGGKTGKQEALFGSGENHE